EGARNLLQPTSAGLPPAYVSPALLDRVGSSSRIFGEEIFGPVLCISAFDDEEEAVAQANATRYGLVSTIWTTDRSTAHRWSRRIQSGCTILRTGACDEVQVPEPPWEPARQSGFGIESGPGSLQSFQRTSAVLMQMQ